MIHPPQVRPEEPIAVTPHDGICGGESQQWLSYPTNPHVRFDERGRETERCRMAQATAPVLDSTCAPTARITSGGRFHPESKVRHVRRLTTGRKSHHSDTYRWLSIARFVAPASCPRFPGIGS